MTLCSWEGNRRSGVALAMRHRLGGLSTYGLNGLDREMSLRSGGARPLYLFLVASHSSKFARLFVCFIGHVGCMKIFDAFDLEVSSTLAAAGSVL